MKVKKTAIFFRNGSRPVPRAVRMMKVAENLGYNSIFCGALRGSEISKNDKWDGFDVVRVGSNYPFLSGKKFFTYIKYTTIFCFGLYQYFRKSKPKLLVASDFEVMLPAILYSRLYKIRLIYNIHDNLSQRYNVPFFIAYILNFFEGIVTLFAESALVPEGFRRDSLPSWCQNKIHIVKNTPGDIQYIDPPKFEGKIKLFYGGWLDWGRGIEELIYLSESNSEIELVIAGSGDAEVVSYIKKFNSVKYLGHISHQESLSETAKAHFIPSFYAPSTIINRYSASNKLAESLAIGRPLLVNSEMEIIKSFKDYDCYLEYQYSDIKQIGPSLLLLIQNREKYLKMCNQSKKLFDAQYTWSIAKKTMISLIRR